MSKTYRVALLPGDGVGHDLIEAACRLLEVVSKKYNFHLELNTLPFGAAAFQEYGDAVPKSTLQLLKEYSSIILGTVDVKNIPTGSPVGILRKELNLYADVRPGKAFKGVWSISPDIDVVCIRENTEGFLADRNLFYGYGEFMPNADQAMSLRLISREACRKVAEFAFRYAEKNGRKTITALHKNVALPCTCGLFLESVREIARKHPAIEYREEYIDNASHDLILHPEKYDIVLTTNLFGDILSDELAALVSGMMPTASYNDNQGLFMPLNHAPRVNDRGKYIVSPMSMILCVREMLGFWGEDKAAGNLNRAFSKMLADSEEWKTFGTLEIINKVNEYLDFTA
jgi:isocitrate/isopropylmalate dehydrogenase